MQCRHRPWWSRGTQLAGVYAVMATLLAGCREEVPESWDTELDYSIGGDSTGADTTLLKPQALGVTEDGTIVVADLSSGQLRLIDGATRAVSRTLGRAGRGPGEFTRPVELAIAPDGRIAVGDAATRRVTVFAPTGDVAREVTLPDGGREIAFDTRGRLHVNRRIADRTPGAPTVSVLSDDTTSVHMYGNFRDDENPLERSNQNSLRLVSAPDGGMWVLHTYRAFVERYDADGKLLRRFSLPLQEGQDTVGPIVEYVDNNPDRIRIKRIYVADDLARMGDSLLLVAMLPNDSTGFHTRLVAFDTLGSQRFTLDLPRRAQRIVIRDGRVFALSFDGRDPARLDVFRVVRSSKD